MAWICPVEDEKKNLIPAGRCHTKYQSWNETLTAVHNQCHRPLKIPRCKVKYSFTYLEAGLTIMHFICVCFHVGENGIHFGCPRWIANQMICTVFSWNKLPLSVWTPGIHVGRIFARSTTMIILDRSAGMRAQAYIVEIERIEYVVRRIGVFPFRLPFFHKR